VVGAGIIASPVVGEGTRLLDVVDGDLALPVIVIIGMSKTRHVREVGAKLAVVCRAFGGEAHRDVVEGGLRVLIRVDRRHRNSFRRSGVTTWLRREVASAADASEQAVERVVLLLARRCSAGLPDASSSSAAREAVESTKNERKVMRAR